jgi:hypothetical protein
MHVLHLWSTGTPRLVAGCLRGARSIMVRRADVFACLREVGNSPDGPPGSSAQVADGLSGKSPTPGMVTCGQYAIHGIGRKHPLVGYDDVHGTTIRDLRSVIRVVDRLHGADDEPPAACYVCVPT